MSKMPVPTKQIKMYYAFVALLYYFLARDFIEQKIAVMSYADELIALAAIPAIILKLGRKKGIRIKRTRDGYWRWLLAVFCFGLLGNLFYQYQPFIRAVLPDVFLFIKFWLWIELGRYLYQRFDISRYAVRIFRHIRIITWFYFILILIDNIIPCFPASNRYGFRSTQLFYFHPTSFASCIIFIMSIMLLLRVKINRKKFIFYEVVLSILACTSLRSKIFGSVMLFWLIVYFVLIRKKKITVGTILMFIPPVILIGWNQIEFFFFSDMIQGSARYQLLITSIKVAYDHFPVGAGFATFASHYSGVCYSPLYGKYGISSVYGITETNTSYISDSFWPMVVGQTGYIGLTAFLIVLYKLFRSIQKSRFNNTTAYAAGLFCLTFLLVESTSAAAFVHPIYMPIAFVLAYILNIADNSQIRLKGDVCI